MKPGTAAEMLMSDLVKIWSFEHNAWWRANSQGYTSYESRAGLYDRDKALSIVASANYGGRLSEEIVETVEPSLKERIACLIREINAQNNRCTASPYYFIVQSKKWVDTAHDGDKEVIYDDGMFTLEEWLAQGDGYTEESWQERHPFWVREVWEDKEIFLTENAALQFMRANAHHLSEPRTYVKQFWRNTQMKTVMQALEVFSGEKLDWR